MGQGSDQNRVWHVTVDGSGRVLLPVELRKELDAESGTTLQWCKDENGLRLQTFAEALTELQEYYSKLAPADVVVTEQLFAQRRAEAARE